MIWYTVARFLLRDNTSMHILIVEDDKTMAEYVSDGLRRAGFVCTHASDGEEGLSAVLHCSYDAIIMDVMLPKVDGLEIIRRARSARIRTPIIVLSARGSVEAKVTGFEAGSDDYLAKPFSVTELVARVQALIRRASTTPEATILREADLEVDVATHRVTRAGRRIDLQPLEYQLLEYLMRNKGRVVSKSTIMERVWDYAFNPHTNVVEVRVSCLRGKITSPGERELIHTIRRFGYVLEAR